MAVPEIPPRYHRSQRASDSPANTNIWQDSGTDRNKLSLKVFEALRPLG